MGCFLQALNFATYIFKFKGTGTCILQTLSDDSEEPKSLEETL